MNGIADDIKIKDKRCPKCGSANVRLRLHIKEWLSCNVVRHYLKCNDCKNESKRALELCELDDLWE